MDILHLRELVKRRLLRLCGKRLRKEIAYEEYLLRHMRDLDYCISCKAPIFYKTTSNIYDNIRRLLERDIYELRREIEREFQKFIAPNLDEYADVCCGKVLIKDISFSNLMFELIYLRFKKIDDGYIDSKDWWQFAMSVITYHTVFYGRL